MSNKEKAYELSKLLKYIANKIEKNPDLIDNLKIEIRVKDVPETPKEKIKLYDNVKNNKISKYVRHIFY